MNYGIAFGIYTVKNQPKRVVARVQEKIVDLYLLAEQQVFEDLGSDCGMRGNI